MNDTFHLEDIPRIKNINKADFIEQYLKPQKPVVIEHFIEDWPAYKKWNFDYINDVCGDLEVPLYDDRPISAKQKFNEAHAKMKMKDYISLLREKPTNYRIFLYNLMKQAPVLQNDFKYFDMGVRWVKSVPFLFFGGENSKVFMHYDIDYANIFHFHFEGKKRVVLFPQSETKYLYKIPNALIARQDIDFSNPDFDKWPALAKAKGMVCELNPGETLYMPEGYWHYMHYLTPGFSMSLRGFPRGVTNFSKAVYNLGVMRYFDNLMRKVAGERWIAYKNKAAITRTHKRNNIKMRENT